MIYNCKPKSAYWDFSETMCGIISIIGTCTKKTFLTWTCQFSEMIYSADSKDDLEICLAYYSTV